MLPLIRIAVIWVIEIAVAIGGAAETTFRVTIFDKSAN